MPVEKKEGEKPAAEPNVDRFSAHGLAQTKKELSAK